MHRDEGGGCGTRQRDRGRKDGEVTGVEAKEVEEAKKAEGDDGLAGYDALPVAVRQKWYLGRGGENRKSHEEVCVWKKEWEGRV